MSMVQHQREERDFEDGVIAANRAARYAPYVEEYGLGYFVIRPAGGGTSRTEHSARYTSIVAAWAARNAGTYEIRVWGEELPPVAA